MKGCLRAGFPGALALGPRGPVSHILMKAMAPFSY